MPRDASGTKTAELYRMVMPDHLCPYGLKAKALLERKGFEIDDRHLTTHEETEAFERGNGVETTPASGSAATASCGSTSSRMCRTRATPATGR